MKNDKKVLLLIGSPKGEKSTSASLGNYLISKLEESEMTTEKVFINRIVNREQKMKELFELIQNSDLIILSFPLYVDSLPAPVIKILKFIKEERDKIERKSTQSFIAICNNGFPEASQNLVALEICKIFSKECGFTWKGGIGVGAGSFLIDGQPLNKRIAMVDHIIKGLNITANALKDNEKIPQEAIDSILEKPVSPNLYLILFNLIFFLSIRMKLIIASGSALLILGMPLMIFGIVLENSSVMNLGITFSIIGLNLFIFGLVTHFKTRRTEDKNQS